MSRNAFKELYQPLLEFATSIGYLPRHTVKMASDLVITANNEE